jgi:hypothetical protein
VQIVPSKSELEPLIQVADLLAPCWHGCVLAHSH